jgi:hypothetical protein
VPSSRPLNYSPLPEMERPAAPGARIASRIRMEDKVWTGRGDAMLGWEQEPGTGAGRLGLPEASEAQPLGWLILFWGGRGGGESSPTCPLGLIVLGRAPRQVFQDGELALMAEVQGCLARCRGSLLELLCLRQCTCGVWGSVCM